MYPFCGFFNIFYGDSISLHASTIGSEGLTTSKSVTRKGRSKLTFINLITPGIAIIANSQIASRISVGSFGDSGKPRVVLAGSMAPSRAFEAVAPVSLF
jgi:hypothetical protein